MAYPLLHDAVTLRHFATCQLLSLCEAMHSPRPTPRWVEAVYSEVQRGAVLGYAECALVLSQQWLGTAVAPSPSDQGGIFKIWVALNGGLRPPVDNAGEAQSIYFAEQLGAMFATDDNVAYAFAERRLGIGRVLDTVEVLRAGVRDGHISAADAVRAVRAIRSNGRRLRRVHPSIVTESYFA